MQSEFEKLFIKIKDLDKMVKNAKIVVDTNVLLSAYQTKPVTFDAIFEVLQELANAGRLVIPSHVIWEFSNNRPNRIKEISNNLHQHADSLEKIINPQQPKELTSILPAIGVLEEKHIEEIVELQEEFKDKIKELKKTGKTFRNGLRDLAIKMGDYIDNDPILLKYKEILSKSIIEVDIKMNEKELEEEGERRVKEKIPPGFRDSTKDSNKYGDLIIWLEICELKEDIIFITFDNKPDWVYKDNKDNVLAAKRELVLEYYEKSGGKSFRILHPGKFVELYREGKVPTAVTEELKEYKVESNYYEEDDDYINEIKRITFMNTYFPKNKNNDEKLLVSNRISVLEERIEKIISQIDIVLSEEEKKEFKNITSEYQKLNLFTLLDQCTLEEKISYQKKLTDIWLKLKQMYSNTI